MTDRVDGQEGPLYLRLYESLRQEIVQGRRTAGERLPSIRALAAQLGVSTGTVRHVYDLLARQGLIESRESRGTFIAFPAQPMEYSGRKERALEIIDETIEELTGLGFSTRQAAIFFDLKLRQKEEANRPLRVAVVAATPEERAIISRSIEQLVPLRLDRIPYSDLLAAPDRLDHGYDLAVAPAELQGELEKAAGSSLPVMPAAITMSRETVLACQSLPGESSLGVLTVSQGFAGILGRELDLLFQGSRQLTFGLLGDPEATRRFMDGPDALILAPGYTDLVGKAEVALFRGDKEGKKTIIRSEFDCDQGSLLYIRQAIERITNQLRGFPLDQKAAAEGGRI